MARGHAKHDNRSRRAWAERGPQLIYWISSVELYQAIPMDAP
jgi:hypothetical protein